MTADPSWFSWVDPEEFFEAAAVLPAGYGTLVIKDCTRKELTVLKSVEGEKLNAGYLRAYFGGVDNVTRPGITWPEKDAKITAWEAFIGDLPSKVYLRIQDFLALFEKSSDGAEGN